METQKLVFGFKEKETEFSFENKVFLVEDKVSLDEDTNKKISETLICARDRIKKSYIESSMSGDADSRIAGMLLTAMGETTPESSTTVNVIIQGDSDAYSV